VTTAALDGRNIEYIRLLVTTMPLLALSNSGKIGIWKSRLSLLDKKIYWTV
jgi:hypothetical protein